MVTIKEDTRALSLRMLDITERMHRAASNQEYERLHKIHSKMSEAMKLRQKEILK